MKTMELGKLKLVHERNSSQWYWVTEVTSRDAINYHKERSRIIIDIRFNHKCLTGVVGSFTVIAVTGTKIQLQSIC